MIINSNVSSIAPKHYYKWFQKAIEFTTIYSVEKEQRTRLETIKEPWAKLKKLRIAIGVKCNWLEEKSHATLLENVRFIANIVSQRRNHPSQEQAIRKQAFYTGWSIQS